MLIAILPRRLIYLKSGICACHLLKRRRARRGCLGFLLRNNLFYEARYPTRIASRVGYGIGYCQLHL